MTTIAFTVVGKPQPKGAHTSFVPKRKDGSYARRWDGTPMVVTRDTNDQQEAAQHAVAVEALRARLDLDLPVWDGPVRCVCRYYYARNKGHFGTGRNAGLLKDSAPLYPTSKADLDKLDRLVFDALTGTVIRDDKLIVGGTHDKFYAADDEPPRIEVEIILLENSTVGVQVADEQMLLAA